MQEIIHHHREGRGCHDESSADLLSNLLRASDADESVLSEQELVGAYRYFRASAIPTLTIQLLLSR